MPSPIKIIKPNDKVVLFIIRADNQLKVYANGCGIYSKTTEGDPPVNEQVSFFAGQSGFRPGYNVVQLVGANWSGPAHYAAEIRVNQDVVAKWDEKLSGNGIVWDTSLEFELSS